MGKLFIRIRQLILITGDLVLLFSSLFLMLLLRYGNLPTEDLLQSHITPFAVLFLLWLLVFFVNGLYDLPLAKNEIQFYKRLFQAVGVNFLISMVFFYIIPFFQIAPKTNLVIVIVIFTLLEFLWRSVFNSIILPHALLNSVLFIGDITKLPELKLALNRKSGLGYSLIAIISPEQNTQEALKNEGIECYKDLGRIRSIVNIHNINTVILGPEFAQNSNVQKELYELIFWGTDIVEWSRTYEELLGRVPVQVLNEKWFWANLQESKKRWYDLIRTAVDVLLALIVLIVFILILPFVAFGIWVESGRPIFYKQKRVGERGKPYFLYKLRSMKKLHPDGSAEVNEPEFTKDNDKRVTKIGKFIRATRIDEMPQAFNVIKREMNFIGPRPERPQFVERLQEDMPYFTVRHLVKPGIAGWAQANNPLHSSLKENLIKLEYDLYYIKNRSFLLDLVILLRTLNIIIRGMGK